MPKYMVHASYTAEGAKGLLAKGGTARRKATEAAVASVGGKLEAFYFAFGESDAVIIVDVPSQAAASALALDVAATGALRSETTVLITPEEVDEAVKIRVDYRPPGA
jgi:uncharacterized protein with GYD domain